MEKTWKWFLRIDIAVTLAGFAAIVGYYVYCFFELSDAMLLGAIIIFALDFFGLPLPAAAALVLLVSRRSRSHWGSCWARFSSCCTAARTPSFWQWRGLHNPGLHGRSHLPGGGHCGGGHVPDHPKGPTGLGEADPASGGD